MAMVSFEIPMNWWF